MTADSAELRLVRSMAVVVAIGAALFALLAIGSIRVQQDFAPAWWTVAAAIAVFALPVLAALAMPVASLRAARILLAAAGTGYLAAAFSSLFLVDPLPVPETQWVLNNTAAATSAVALAAPRSLGWMYNALISIIVIASRTRGPDMSGFVAGIQDGLYSFMFCAVFIALAHFTIDRARLVDEETRAVTRHAAVVAAAHARSRERQRIDAVLHDSVLSVLMLASRGGDSSAELRAQAGSALAELTAGVHESDAAEDAPVDLRRALRARLDRVNPRIPLLFPAEVPGVPPAVADALADAAAEAARNSLRHAHLNHALPTVRVRVDHDRLIVSIDDDGVGFDPEDVPAERLGLRASIVGRLESRPDTTARIRSAPGRGTQIELEWTVTS